MCNALIRSLWPMELGPLYVVLQKCITEGRVGGGLCSGSPLSVLYDNTRIAVAKILGDGKRLKTRAFMALQSHYLFEDKFGRPCKGNDKGNVEGLVKLTKAKFLTPIPRASSYEELNARLEQNCLARSPVLHPRLAPHRWNLCCAGRRIRVHRQRSIAACQHFHN